jgi:BlaI family penicillinase repressor
MKRPARISEAEWEIMKVIWKHAPASARDIVRALGTRRRWSPATVKTFLNRLLAKGVIRYEKRGRAYFYSAAGPEAEFRTAEADSFLRRVFDGAFSPLLAHFVQTRRLTARDWEALEQIVRERKRTS